ncbi:MAG: Rieske 2Fe-2S domain-containing protein [Patescibacteria group bacterium]|jgi:nitrite reductase/ring-hydroxylating ferredoxin subunit
MPIKRKLPVCSVGEIAEGSAKTFRFGFRDGIAYNDHGTLKAYINFCTHMGGPLELVSATRFRCRWHEAEFDPVNGERLCGEAPEGTKLTPITLITEGDKIFAMLELKDEFE